MYTLLLLSIIGFYFYTKKILNIYKKEKNRYDSFWEFYFDSLEDVENFVMGHFSLGVCIAASLTVLICTYLP